MKSVGTNWYAEPTVHEFSLGTENMSAEGNGRTTEETVLISQ